MPGINQLPHGSEFAAAISLIWSSFSWMCSCLLLWLTWLHHEGWSYLALLSISSLISSTFSIIQQSRDITWYTDTVSEQFRVKAALPPEDPEEAIAGGSYGVDLVLYYLQYYNYNVQAMLVMFWAAELCQLTYQIGERRKVRRVLRRLHSAGKLIAWLLPMVTILCLRIPSLRHDFVVFILIADLPLMLSLAISSSLMIAVTIRYVQSRQKFTQWSPPKGSLSSSEAGTSSQTSSKQNESGGNKGLYDRWLMIRFTIAFVLLGVFEVTNTLFQITTLKSNIADAKAAAPDLSVGRAIQTFFLFMPGTTPGIFLYIVFGTTASLRKQAADLLVPARWRTRSSTGSGGWLCCVRRRQPRLNPEALDSRHGGITVQRSLTITSANRAARRRDEEDLEMSDPSDISLDAIPKRSASALSSQASRMKPLPLVPPTSKFFVRCASAPPLADAGRPAFGGMPSVEEKESIRGGSLSRTNTDDSMGIFGEDRRMGLEHSDDSGPILPIQRPEVRFSTDIFSAVGGGDERSKGYPNNFSRPRR